MRIRPMAIIRERTDRDGNKSWCVVWRDEDKDANLAQSFTDKAQAEQILTELNRQKHP